MRRRRIGGHMAALGRLIRQKWVCWLLGPPLVFLVFPRLDIIVSGWFWTPEQGWFLARSPFAEFIRKGLPAVLAGGLILAVLLWIAGRTLKRRILGMTERAVAYLWTTAIIGPGLMANTLFKENWGRARPNQIAEFGGPATFTPPLMVTDQCANNCSFVSGHGAMGFWVTALAFLAAAPIRRRVFLATLAFGGMVGGVRIVQGGHFLSDVVYAGVFTILINWALAKLILPADEDV